MNDLLAVLPGFAPVPIEQRAERIRGLVITARTCIIEIGRELIAAKAELAHGEWLPWLKDEFGWTVRTADKYMEVVRAFKLESDSNFDGLTIDATALYALAAPDVPQPVREEAVHRAQAGEHITKAEADQIIADAERRFQQQLDQVRLDAEAQVEAEIARAGKKFDRSRAAMEAEIERLQAAGELPGVAEICEALRKFTGQSKLTPKQYKLIALTLNTSIADGSRVYQPVADEVIEQNQINLEIAGPMVRALEYFAGAPDPEQVWRVCPLPLRAAARRNAVAATAWLKKFNALLKKEQDDAGRG
jgi:hypothetical protein